ncbi:glycosyltransferase family 39 protein [Nitrospinae bacterium AH_259_B05_G02_I21]|nr:glycosyltransferase family 39 protein [Nitrospinae bacterium AH_259_B05_G02_I21]
MSGKAWVAVLILVASGYLTFTGLDNTYFWDDEAEMGIVARNFLSTGQLTAWDGRNLFAPRNGKTLTRELTVNEPPLSSLVTALSFRLLGISTWAARFPFAIAGLATLFVFAMILREEFGTQSWLWVYALGSLALSVTFLLFIRQCRYYALSLLFSSLTYYAYRKCLATRHLLWFIIVGISSILLFFSNYLVGGAFLGSLTILHLVFHRKSFSIIDWGKMALSVTIFAGATVPYGVTHSIWYRPAQIMGPPEPWLARKLTVLWWNLIDIDRISALPWVTVVLLTFLLILRRERKLGRITLEWAIVGLGNVIIVALTSPQPTNVPTVADVRYLIASLPFFAGFTGVFIWLLHQWKKPLGPVMLAALLCSNVFTINMLDNRIIGGMTIIKGARWLLPAYIREVHNNYPTSIAVASNFLNKNARQDDLVYVLPSEYNWPLLFYVGEKIKLCCFLNEKSPLSKEDMRKLQAPLFIDEHYPDWVVVFGAHPEALKMVRAFSRPHLRGLQVVNFNYQLVQTLDAYWRQTQRPELFWHSFGPKTDFDRDRLGVYIFRRAKY